MKNQLVIKTQYKEYCAKFIELLKEIGFEYIDNDSNIDKFGITYAMGKYEISIRGINPLKLEANSYILIDGSKILNSGTICDTTQLESIFANKLRDRKINSILD